MIVEYWEVIVGSGVAGGVLSQLGGKLIDKFIRDKRTDKAADIANLSSRLDFQERIIERLEATVARLEDLACYHDNCAIRLNADAYLKRNNNDNFKK